MIKKRIALWLCAGMMMAWGGCAKSEHPHTAAIVPKPSPLVLWDLGKFTLNTADTDNSYYVITKLQLGYNGNKKLELEMVNRRTQLRDAVVRVISPKKQDELDSAEEREKLAEELKAEINRVLTDGEISKVYFEEFIIP